MKCSRTGLTIKFELSDYLYFKLLTVLPFFTAVYAIWQHANSLWWLVGYLLVIAWHTNLTYKLFCPHCVYYKQSSRTTKCIMIWGVPKFYKDKKGPASKAVSTLIIVDILLVSVFPLYWVLWSWHLLVIYLLSLLILLISLIKNECSRCICFDCAKNSVPKEVRQRYIESNGSINSASARDYSDGPVVRCHTR